MESQEDIFQVHREYWETICKHPDPHAERATVHALMDTLDDEDSPWTDALIRNGLDRLKNATSPGLDGWTAQAVKRIPKDSYPCLALLFSYIERHGVWPPHLTRVKTTLLIKPGTDGSRPSHWRPIAVTSLWYRLYGQCRLPLLSEHVIPWLPEGILGGVPQRHSSTSVLNLLASFERLPDEPELPPLYGVALDASKCFDRIRWSGVWSLLHSIQVPPSLIRAMSTFYLAHQRFTHIRGSLDLVPWQVSSGLLQGCPLSVLTTVLLVATWHVQIPAPVSAQSFIDDRILTASSQDALRAAWDTSELWNNDQGWKTNEDKTFTFTSLRPAPKQILPGLSPCRGLVYLGHDVHTVQKLAKEAHLKRAKKATDTGLRISQLPLNASVTLRNSLIAMVMAPQWAYGILPSPPSLTVQGNLEKAFRKASWARRKQMHCWEAAVATMYDPTKHSAWGSSIYRHILAFSLAIRHGPGQRISDLWNSVPPLNPQGPVQTTLFFLRTLGFTILEPFRIQAPEGRIFNLKYTDLAFLKVIRQLMREHFFQRAQKLRKHLAAEGQIDWEATRRLYQKAYYPHISELTCVLSDGLWTAPRLTHSGHLNSRNCWWCQSEEQTPGHLFWCCPHFSSSRPTLMTQHENEVSRTPAAYHCGVCFLAFPENLRRQWNVVQQFMSTVTRSCNEFYTLSKKQQTQQRQQSSPYGGSGDDGGARGSSDLPPLPHPGLWARARQLDFSALVGRNAPGHTWPFTQLQLHRLQWFLTLIRVVDDPRSLRFQPVSLIEVYISYLITNGWARFLSTAPESAQGGRITSHLEAFRDGLQYIQATACYDYLLPCIEKGNPRVMWLRRIGLPDSLEMGKGILIPHWQEVRRYLCRLSRETPDLEPGAPPNAQLWRRLSVGIPGSQVDPSLGTLPTRPLAWGPATRIARKMRPPTWIRDIHTVRPFVRQIEADPRFETTVGSRTLRSIMCDGGVSSPMQIRNFGRTQMLQGQRTQRFIEHARHAFRRGVHISSTPDIGVRPICRACGKCGPMTNAYQWLALPCPDIATRNPTKEVLTFLETHLATTCALKRAIPALY